MYYHTVQGKRESNEDQHFIFSNLDGKDCDKNCINMIGVFDGHGGKLVSKYLKENLPDYFTKKFKEEQPYTRIYLLANDYEEIVRVESKPSLIMTSKP
jgi:serine/threonine protein phosphatase PrpC